MRVVRFFLGPQHAIICTSLVVLYSIGLILLMFGYATPAGLFEASKYIGVGYLVSLALTIVQREA